MKSESVKISRSSGWPGLALMDKFYLLTAGRCLEFPDNVGSYLRLLRAELSKDNSATAGCQNSPSQIECTAHFFREKLNAFFQIKNAGGLFDNSLAKVVIELSSLGNESVHPRVEG